MICQQEHARLDLTEFVRRETASMSPNYLTEFLKEGGFSQTTDKV